MTALNRHISSRRTSYRTYSIFKTLPSSFRWWNKEGEEAIKGNKSPLQVQKTQNFARNIPIIFLKNLTSNGHNHEIIQYNMTTT